MKNIDTSDSSYERQRPGIGQVDWATTLTSQILILPSRNCRRFDRYQKPSHLHWSLGCLVSSTKTLTLGRVSRSRTVLKSTLRQLTKLRVSSTSMSSRL